MTPNWVPRPPATVQHMARWLLRLPIRTLRRVLKQVTTPPLVMRTSEEEKLLAKERRDAGSWGIPPNSVRVYPVGEAQKIASYCRSRAGLAIDVRENSLSVNAGNFPGGIKISSKAYPLLKTKRVELQHRINELTPEQLVDVWLVIAASKCKKQSIGVSVSALQQESELRIGYGAAWRVMYEVLEALKAKFPEAYVILVGESLKKVKASPKSEESYQQQLNEGYLPFDISSPTPPSMWPSAGPTRGTNRPLPGTRRSGPRCPAA